MTFTEAAIEVLRREGKPLHFKKIAEIAVRDDLLDHVGKIPDEVMGGQLATHCRLPHADRKVVVVQLGTFALAEWGLDEDPAGLTGIPEPPPADEIPYRGRERHPTPSREMARSTGRGEARGRRREEGEERRGRRFPPPAEVAYEILAGSDRPLSLADVAAQGAERFLMPDAFVRDSSALGAALLEDNRRRESAGRRPLFALEGDRVSLSAQPEPGERAAAPLAAARPAAAAADLRRAALLVLRRRIRECDPPTVEHVVAKLLEAMGLHELKVAKRGRDHVVYTGRRKMGLAEVRHCVRIVRGGVDPGRRDVAEVRRDVSNYGAQIGVVVSAGEAAREARGEATAPGQVPVLLLCGDALAEALTENAVGCRPVVVPEIDEEFFKSAAETAAADEAARRARRDGRERESRERDAGPERREGGERAGARAPPAEREHEMPRPLAPVPEAPAANEGAEPTVASPPPLEAVNESTLPVSSPPPSPENADVEVEAADVADDEEGDEEEGAEAGEGEAPAPGAATGAPGDAERPGGEGRRRRRRRRRRGSRGRNREGAVAAAPGSGGASASDTGGPPRSDMGGSVPLAGGAQSEPAQPASTGGERAGEADPKAAAKEPSPGDRG